MKITSGNIEQICNKAIKKLEEVKMPDTFKGFILTPYGWIRSNGTKLNGSKRAIKYLKRQVEKLH